MNYIKLYGPWPLFVRSSHPPFPIECVPRWYWKQDIKGLLVNGGRTITTHQEEMGCWCFFLIV